MLPGGSRGQGWVTFSLLTVWDVLQTYTDEDRLIITQLPFATTIVDFWALVWDYTCTSVVILNELCELDKVSSPQAALLSPDSFPWDQTLFAAFVLARLFS